MTESDATKNYDVAAGDGGIDQNISMKKEPSESTKTQAEIKDSSKQDKNFPHHSTKGVDLKQSPSTNIKDDTGEVNMEAAMTTDDLIRAGGFGARDDIGSFLPVATDSTDFEASLRSAWDFEEPQGETLRPGLGWTESMNEN